MANIQKSGLRTGTLPLSTRPLTYCSSDQDLGWSRPPTSPSTQGPTSSSLPYISYMRSCAAAG
ncbi:hypothetical protein ACRRTK_006848 [Alexandromys fortis]